VSSLRAHHTRKEKFQIRFHVCEKKNCKTEVLRRENVPFLSINVLNYFIYFSLDIFTHISVYRGYTLKCVEVPMYSTYQPPLLLKQVSPRDVRCGIVKRPPSFRTIGKVPTEPQQCAVRTAPISNKRCLPQTGCSLRSSNDADCVQNFQSPVWPHHVTASQNGELHGLYSSGNISTGM
jgi:hypothetical protein